MQTNWANEHLDALREYLAKGMSYSETVQREVQNGLFPQRRHRPR
jgi:hypothetical protein